MLIEEIQKWPFGYSKIQMMKKTTTHNDQLQRRLQTKSPSF